MIDVPNAFMQVNSSCVTDVVMWGNVNGTLLGDLSSARVHQYDGAIVGPDWFSLPVTEVIQDEDWLNMEFPTLLSGLRITPLIISNNKFPFQS